MRRLLADQEPGAEVAVEAFDALRQVHGVAIDRPGLAAEAADASGGNRAGGDADAKAKRFAAEGPPRHQFQQRPPRPGCPGRMRRQVGRRVEGGDDGIADEADDDAVMGADHLGRRIEELVEEGDDVGRRAPFGEAGEAFDVGEQDAGVASLRHQRRLAGEDRAGDLGRHVLAEHRLDALAPVLDSGPRAHHVAGAVHGDGEQSGRRQDHHRLLDPVAEPDEVGIEQDLDEGVAVGPRRQVAPGQRALHARDDPEEHAPQRRDHGSAGEQHQARRQRQRGDA